MAPAHWNAADIPDLSGKVVIVTGANSGIGLVSAGHLAKKGARVYCLCRSKERAEEAIKRVKAEYGPLSGALEFIQFDLCDLKSAKLAAETFLQKEKRLDILLLSAGVMALPYQLSKDGIEVQACNHFGHYALTMPLIRILKSTAMSSPSGVRVACVSSLGHRGASDIKLDSLEDVNRSFRSRFAGDVAATWIRYGNSKLYNILYMMALQRELGANSNIFCNSLHPGAIATELDTKAFAASYGTSFMKPARFLWSKIRTYLLMNPEDGAVTSLYCCTADEIKQQGIRGQYLIPYGQVTSPKSKFTTDELADKLHALSEKICVEKIGA